MFGISTAAIVGFVCGSVWGKTIFAHVADWIHHINTGPSAKK